MQGFRVGYVGPQVAPMARKWDIPLPTRWDPMPLGPCSKILLDYLRESDPRT